MLLKTKYFIIASKLFLEILKQYMKNIQSDPHDKIKPSYSIEILTKESDNFKLYVHYD